MTYFKTRNITLELFSRHNDLTVQRLLVAVSCGGCGRVAHTCFWMSQAKVVRLASLSIVCLLSLLYVFTKYDVDLSVSLGVRFDADSDTNSSEVETIRDIADNKEGLRTTVTKSEDSEVDRASMNSSQTVPNNTQSESNDDFDRRELEVEKVETISLIDVKVSETAIDTFVDKDTQDGDTISQTVIVRNDSAQDIIDQQDTETTLIKDNDLPPCPLIPDHLVGRLKVILDERTWKEIEDDITGVKEGGEFSPPNCDPKDSIAIIIPFRNRDSQLRVFLNFIHPILKRQNIHYRIFVISQDDDETFNRAMLFNVGFSEASKISDWDCFVFHDVDLLPEDDRNLYTCPDMPRHMSVAVNKFKYKLPYKDLFGGVSAISKEHLKLVNGFSNQFWGWGGEDDDMSRRVRDNNLTITRYQPEIAR